mgnify:CR=1 FL=1
MFYTKILYFFELFPIFKIVHVKVSHTPYGFCCLTVRWINEIQEVEGDRKARISALTDQCCI